MSRLDFILNIKKIFGKEKYRSEPVVPEEGTISFSQLEKVSKEVKKEREKEKKSYLEFKYPWE